MGLSGSVRALSLDQLLELLSASGHSGTLRVTSKEKTCVLVLKDGVCYIDQRGGGGFRLGEILVQLGTISAEDVTEALEVQEGSSDRIGDVLTRLGKVTEDELNAAYRAQLEEEIYELFVLEDARFDFDRSTPDGFDESHLPGFGVRSILMEAARRFDEWRHIKNNIQSNKLFYELTDDPEMRSKVSSALAEEGVDAAAAFGEGRSIEEILPLLGMSQFRGLSLLARMISEGHLSPLSARELEGRFREYIDSEPERALRYFECAMEQASFEPRQRNLEKLLFQSEAFTDPQRKCSLAADTKGKRALQLLFSLFRQQVRCEFKAYTEGAKIRLVLLSDALLWKGGYELGEEHVLRYLVKERLASEVEVEDARRARDATGQSLQALFVASGRVSMDDWLRAHKWAVLFAVFDIFFWESCRVEVSTGPLVAASAESGDMDLPLVSWLQDEVTSQVKQWERVTQVVPSVRAIYVLTAKGKRSISSAFDDLNLFDGRRSLEQVLKLLRKPPLKFFAWFYEQHQGGRVEPLDEAGYRRRLQECLDADRVRDALATCSGAIESGLQAAYFSERRDVILQQRGEANDQPDAILEGDLASFSLAEVLQSFHVSKRSGTLRIFTDDREKEICFEDGQVYLLEVDDDTGDFLLDAGFMANVNEGLGGDFNVVAQGLISENELSDQVAEQIKEEVYDVFLWDGACFEFTRDELPEEFYSTASNVTKYSLNTSMFLLEAVRRISEWERVREILPHDELVVAFDSYETKMRAVTERGSQEVLLLVDGRHTIRDVLRISGARRFHAISLLSDLLSGGSLSLVEVDEDESGEEQERSGEVGGEGFVEVLRSLQQNEATGLLRVTDGRRSKELAFYEGVPHRTSGFQGGSGDAEVDRELSTRESARDFAEVVVFSGARYQFLPDVLPAALDTEESRRPYALNAEGFLAQYFRSGKAWKALADAVERDKPLSWRDDSDARQAAESVPLPANILDWIDGRRTTEEVIRGHPDGRYLALQSISELLKSGLLVYADPVALEESSDGDDEDWDFGLE